MTADWSEDDIVDSLKDASGQSYTEDTHHGQPIYQPNSEYGYNNSIWLGVLGDGQFVFSGEDTVRVLFGM